MFENLFRSAIPAWGWAIVGLVPPLIVALYFLKLRRQPLEVPSTYLWRKSIEDLHVNSLWQRLRQSLLLLLQLLLVALAMLALLRPGWQGTNLEGNRFIFMVDNSASMGASDVAEAESRLALAKQQAAGLIDQMDSGMSAMLLSFNREPRVEQEFTQNKRKLREQLDEIKLEPATTNLLGALQLADGLANPGQIVDVESNVAVEVGGEATKVYILSDGRFAAVDNFSLGNLDPVYLPTGSTSASNLSITAFSTRQGEGLTESRQAFVQVTNWGEAERDVTVELELNGSFLDAKSAKVPAGDSRGITFALDATSTGALEARIASESTQAATDALASDNVAYAALNESSSGRVLVVTPGSPVLKVALATERIARVATVEFAEPAVLTTDDHQARADDGTYDLIVYDQCVPSRMPRCHTLMIGRLPPGPDWRPPVAEPPATEGEEPAAPAPTAAEDEIVTLPQIIDWSREHPLLANVELGNLLIDRSRKLTLPRGGRALIDSTEGPIAAIAPREGFEDVVLGYEILIADGDGQRVNTNWYNRHSFPTFWLDTIDYFVQQSEGGEANPYRPGLPVEFRTASRAPQLVVQSPDGTKTTVERNDQQRYAFQNATAAGVYDVLQGAKVLQRFAVNLFDGQESDIRLRTQPSDDPNDNVADVSDIQIGYNTVSAERAPARQEIWRPLLAAALVVLLLEWYIYNRRVYL